MCPAPARTTDAAIVAATRSLLEQHGPSGVTMQAVAAAVGIRAPSLYKRFADRAGLLRAVEAEALQELTALLTQAAVGHAPEQALRRMADAYRGFARAAPSRYALLFAPGAWDAERDAWRAAAAGPLLAVTTALVGAEAALPAARLLTAFLHGWVGLELAGAFRLGGDPEAAYAFAFTALLAGLRPA